MCATYCVALDTAQKHLVILILPGSLVLPTSTINPPTSFIHGYVSLYIALLQAAFALLSSRLPLLKINLSKELSHCSGSPTVIKNLNDRIFFEEWLSSILSSGKVVQVPPHECKILSPHLVVLSRGKRRVVGNFEGLNRLSVKDSFVGPSILVIVQSCSKFMFHCKVHLKLGFNNVNVHEASKSLLSFAYNDFFFRYEVMPLGISSGPYTFDNWAKEFSSIVQQFIPSKVFYYQDD